MEYRHLGRTGVQVSSIGLGSDDFGDGTPPELAEAIMLRALDASINLIDTGNLYAGGTSEAIMLSEAKGYVRFASEESPYNLLDSIAARRGRPSRAPRPPGNAHRRGAG